jgi:hypothetical protein
LSREKSSGDDRDKILVTEETRLTGIHRQSKLSNTYSPNLDNALKMDFTEIYKQSSSLVVRRTDTFQITRTWLLDASPSPTHASLTTSKSKSTTSSTSACEVVISHVGWSCDSEYILAACAKRGVVHLIKLRDAEWNGRINAGAEGDK